MIFEIDIPEGYENVKKLFQSPLIEDHELALSMLGKDIMLDGYSLVCVYDNHVLVVLGMNADIIIQSYDERFNGDVFYCEEIKFSYSSKQFTKELLKMEYHKLWFNRGNIGEVVDMNLMVEHYSKNDKFKTIIVIVTRQFII